MVERKEEGKVLGPMISLSLSISLSFSLSFSLSPLWKETDDVYDVETKAKKKRKKDVVDADVKDAKGYRWACCIYFYDRNFFI